MAYEKQSFEDLLTSYNGGRNYGAAAKLADALGVSEPTVKRWREGNMPAEEMRSRLAKVLGVSVEALKAALAQAAELRLQVSDSRNRSAYLAKSSLLPVIGVATDALFDVDLAAHPEEALPIPATGAQNLFALRIEGCALEPLARSGDYAVLAQQQYASGTQIVLARLPGGCVLRRYFPSDKSVELKAENETGAKCFVSPNELTIVGVVRYFVRKP